MADSNRPSLASRSPFCSGRSRWHPEEITARQKIIVKEIAGLTSKTLTPDVIFGPRMRKSDILIVVLGATTLISFCSCAYNRNTTGYSMAQATAQPSYGHQKMTQTSSREVVPTSSRREKLAAVAETGAADFSRRLQGGTLLRFESGLIVVEPANLRGSLQPTA